MSYQPPQGYGPPQGALPPADTSNRSRSIAIIVALGIVAAGGSVALSILSAAPAAPAATPASAAPAPQLAMAPMPDPALPTDPAPIPQRQPPVRRVTDDSMVAGRIGAMEGAQREAALCAIVAQSDPTVSAGLLERNPLRFFGHLWTFDAEVIQIEDVSGAMGSFLLVMLDDEANSVVSVTTYVRPDDTVVTGRRVRVYGRIAGTYTYETRSGSESTVPKVLATAVVQRRDAPRCRPR